MWMNLLFFGGIGFWCVAATVLCLSTIFMHNIEESDNGDWWGSMIVTFAVGFLLLFCFGDMKEWCLYIVHNPWTSLRYGSYYIGLGIVYSIAKWTHYVFCLREEYIKIKKHWLVRKNEESMLSIPVEKILSVKNPEIPVMLKPEWLMYTKHSLETNIEHFARGILSPRDHVSIISAWIIWWPVSFMWFVINDPVKRLGRGLVRLFNGTYTRVVTIFRGDIAKDF